MDDKTLQEQYQEYAFLTESDGTAEPKASAAEGESEAISKWCHHMEHMRQLIKRTYEGPYLWYYVVFKPYNRTYSRDPEWYQHKAMDYCRRFFSRPKILIQVKEQDATKTHVHALVCTDQKLIDGCSMTRYKLSVSLLHDIGDRIRTLDYLVKESLKRQFIIYRDYIFHPKNL